MIAAQRSANRLHRTGNKTTNGRVLPAKFLELFVGSSALTSGFLPTKPRDSAVASV
jgi:hypothetical protein